MAEVEFTDNSVRVKETLEEACMAWLYEAAGEIQARTKRNTPVDTGQLKSSWKYVVDENKQKAVIGSTLENAIWNEFGTGEYALNGDGRKKTPWAYKDAKGNWHSTRGKHPQRSLFNAINSIKGKLQNSLKNKLKGLGK